jgi:hypothetical protein
MRVLRSVLSGLAALLLLAGSGRAVSPDALDLRDVTRLLLAGDTPPAADEPAWEPATFPQYWGPAIRRRTTEGWLRLPFTLPAAPSELWAAYLPRVSAIPN